MIDIDQEPNRAHPAFQPATYTGVFTPIRELLLACRSLARGYTARGGDSLQRARRSLRSVPEGDGIKVEMHFSAGYLRAVRPVQEQARYNRETLEIKYKRQDHPRSAWI